MSLFAAVELAPRDPILGLNEAFNADTRTDQGQPWRRRVLRREGKMPLLRAVRDAEKARVEAALPRGYLPIEGIAAYDAAVQKLLLGNDSPLIAAGRVVTVQALGGTGALKIGADFLKRLNPNAKVAISDPSWENHRALFESAGFEVVSLSVLRRAHARRQLRRHAERAEQLRRRHDRRAARLLPQPDRRRPDARPMEAGGRSRQGAQSGAVPRHGLPGLRRRHRPDAAAVRLFAASELNVFVSSSFSKTFSLYGERVGALSIVTASKEEAARVLSQLKRVIRTNYSNPPTHGGSVVAAVLASAGTARHVGKRNSAEMRDRIRAMRNGLVERLKASGVDRDFSFVNAQRGMFSYSGLTAPQVDRLREEFGIYAVGTGRICVAALNTRNLDVVANAIAHVLK